MNEEGLLLEWAENPLRMRIITRPVKGHYLSTYTLATSDRYWIGVGEIGGPLQYTRPLTPEEVCVWKLTGEIPNP